MSRHGLVYLAVLGLAATVACSGESPVSPTSAYTDPRDVDPAAKGVPGVYVLTFFKSGPGGLEPVDNLPVLSEELILGAHVSDRLGVPAQAGAVTFQYCSMKGLPPNDITRADEAPSSACADGSAKWANLHTISVNESGDAFMNFGVVRIPRTVGFRFRYAGKGPIANGMSAADDFTWVP